MIAMAHVHHFIPGSDPAKPPLVLLHGSGGDEQELVPLAGDLAPGSPILVVRGGIPFDDGFAFFHRLADRSINEADIASRAVILANFIEAASTQYSLSRAPIAIGFSNGAIVAAALLLTRPGLLAGAILEAGVRPTEIATSCGSAGPTSTGC